MPFCAALAGRYAIERELGHGGMATVYLADDVKHHRVVAVKVLRPELAASLGPERFLREVEIAARLNHPHILALYDSGEAGGFLFYVIPHIKGESLRAKREREKQLPVDEALAITRQVAAALSHAHAHQVIHRDIKPDNILLHEGEAMVADFGIALAVNAAAAGRVTRTGFALGTPEYMSPEQGAGERTLDARSDVYSLACVLYEMLAGEPPYTGPTAQALLAKVMVDPVPAVRRLRPTVPPGVDQALRTALAKAPADRFASMTAFVDALAAPAAPRPPSVAVLPFRNLSADPENEYFADGITEDVIAHLSKIRALKVISRTSVMPFKQREQSLKEIAARLEAATLLDGSVRRAGDRVRIVAQLVDAETDRHLWVETYDRQLTDIFGIQTDVALHIAEALKAELSVDERTRIRKEPTSDLRASQLYLLGRHWLVRYTPAAMQRAIEHFRGAIGRDPTYALAYASVAMTYAELAESGAMPPDAAARDAKQAAAHALRIDPQLGEAHCTVAYLKTIWDFDWAGAEAEFKRALELSPNSADTYDLYGPVRTAAGRARDGAPSRALPRSDPRGRADVGVRSRSRTCPRHAGMGGLQAGKDGRGVGGSGAGRRAHAGEHAVAGAAGTGVCTGRQGRPGPGCAAPARRARAGDVRLTLPSGLRRHRAGRARSGDGPAGARVRAACRRDLRDQGLVSVRAPADTPAIPGPARPVEPEPPLN